MNSRIEQLKRMLEQEPNDSFCLYGLGQEYANAGELDTAADYFRRAIEADPDHCYSYYHLAKVQDEAGDEAAAVETLRQGLKRAENTGDEKALGEIAGYLDALT